MRDIYQDNVSNYTSCLSYSFRFYLKLIQREGIIHVINYMCVGASVGCVRVHVCSWVSVWSLSTDMCVIIHHVFDIPFVAMHNLYNMK